jgi:antitoxin VapB
MRIRRHGRAIILEPAATNWAWLDALVGPRDEDFVGAATGPPAGHNTQDSSRVSGLCAQDWAI